MRATLTFKWILQLKSSAQRNPVWSRQDYFFPSKTVWILSSFTASVLSWGEFWAWPTGTHYFWQEETLSVPWARFVHFQTLNGPSLTQGRLQMGTVECFHPSVSRGRSFQCCVSLASVSLAKSVFLFLFPWDLYDWSAVLVLVILGQTG